MYFFSLNAISPTMPIVNPTPMPPAAPIPTPTPPAVIPISAPTSAPAAVVPATPPAEPNPFQSCFFFGLGDWWWSLGGGGFGGGFGGGGAGGWAGSSRWLGSHVEGGWGKAGSFGLPVGGGSEGIEESRSANESLVVPFEMCSPLSILTATCSTGVVTA